MAASALYLKVKLQGLGWRGGGLEEGYERLKDRVSRLVEKDKKLIRADKGAGSKTATVQICQELDAKGLHSVPLAGGILITAD